MDLIEDDIKQLDKKAREYLETLSKQDDQELWVLLLIYVASPVILCSCFCILVYCCCCCTKRYCSSVFSERKKREDEYKEVTSRSSVTSKGLADQEAIELPTVPVNSTPKVKKPKYVIKLQEDQLSDIENIQPSFDLNL